MTPKELNFIKDAFSQIIDDIAGNPDWGDAARSVASNLGTLERQLKEKVVELPSEMDEAADTFAHNGDVNGVGGEDYEDDLRITFKGGAEWLAGQGVSFYDVVEDDEYMGYTLGELIWDKAILVNKFKPGDKVIVQIRKK